jgi:hypothetical protein
MKLFTQVLIVLALLSITACKESENKKLKEASVNLIKKGTPKVIKKITLPITLLTTSHSAMAELDKVDPMGGQFVI